MGSPHRLKRLHIAVFYVAVVLLFISFYHKLYNLIIVSLKSKFRKRLLSILTLYFSYYLFFLVRIFPHSDWIRRDTEHLSVFSPNAGKYGENTDQKKLRIWILFTQWRQFRAKMIYEKNILLHMLISSSQMWIFHLEWVAKEIIFH